MAKRHLFKTLTRLFSDPGSLPVSPNPVFTERQALTKESGQIVATLRTAFFKTVIAINVLLRTEGVSVCQWLVVYPGAPSDHPGLPLAARLTRPISIPFCPPEQAKTSPVTHKGQRPTLIHWLSSDVNFRVG